VHSKVRLQVTKQSELLAAQMTVMRLVTYSSSNSSSSSVIISLSRGSMLK